MDNLFESCSIPRHERVDEFATERRCGTLKSSQRGRTTHFCIFDLRQLRPSYAHPISKLPSVHAYRIADGSDPPTRGASQRQTPKQLQLLI